MEEEDNEIPGRQAGKGGEGVYSVLGTAFSWLQGFRFNIVPFDPVGFEFVFVLQACW